MGQVGSAARWRSIAVSTAWISRSANPFGLKIEGKWWEGERWRVSQNRCQLCGQVGRETLAIQITHGHNPQADTTHKKTGRHRIGPVPPCLIPLKAQLFDLPIAGDLCRRCDWWGDLDLRPLHGRELIRSLACGNPLIVRLHKILLGALKGAALFSVLSPRALTDQDRWRSADPSQGFRCSSSGSLHAWGEAMDSPRPSTTQRGHRRRSQQCQLRVSYAYSFE